MTVFKVGNKVIRHDGYYEGEVIAIITETKRLNPLYALVIRQRRVDSDDDDTVVTRDIDGNTATKLEKFRYIKK